jgi:hypothetical protein
MQKSKDSPKQPGKEIGKRPIAELVEDYFLFLDLWENALNGLKLCTKELKREDLGEVHRQRWLALGKRYGHQRDKWAKRLRDICIELAPPSPATTYHIRRLAAELVVPHIKPTLRRLRLAAAECKLLLNGVEIVVPRLNEHQYDALRTMLEWRAFSLSTRATGAKLLAKINRSRPTRLASKVMPQLVTGGLASSKRGGGGGYWLTEKGRRLAERLKE